jgi:glycosyltransferase involved in cell wall biosynthesis
MKTDRPKGSNAQRPLTVCFATGDYPLDGAAAGGGMGAHAHALAQGIARLGHHVLVVTESNGKPMEFWDGPVQVHALERNEPRYWKLGSLVPVPWVRRSFAVWNALKRLRRQYPIELVRFPDGYGEGFRFSWSPFWPYVVHLHGPASLLQRWDGRFVPPARSKLEEWLERRPAQHATLLVAGTRKFADLLAARWSLDPNRIRIIRNPVDVETFSASPAVPRPVERTVLFVGHLQWFKGPTVLAAAIPLVLAKQRNVRFRFIGNDTKSAPGGGSIRRFLEDSLAPAGALHSVSFLGPVPHSELVTHYRSCAALVLPSFQEVYGNVVIEAMACGRPCIVTSEVGASELIANGKTGFVVPPDNPEELAEAILAVLALPDAASRQMGVEARAAIERTCAVSVIAEQTVDAYRAAIRGESLKPLREVAGAS